MPKYQPQYWVHSDPNAPEEPHAPSVGPCPSRCNHRWRQAAEAHDAAMQKWIGRGCTGDEPQPPETEPWPGEPVICRKCAAIARGALRELPLAYKALDGYKYLSRTASADEEHRGRSDVPPSPSPGADHQDEICRTISAWEDSLRQHLRRCAAADTGERENDLAASIEYLNANYAAMIERPECAGDFVDEISRLHRITVAMVKNKPVRKHLPSPCPSPGCGFKSLVQEEGIAGKPWYVECSERLGGCGRLYSEADWSWFSQLLVKGHVQMAMTPVDA
jgi:hypothetical protein